MTREMALPDAEREAIAKILAVRLAGLPFAASGEGELEIGHDFPVYILRRSDLEGGRRLRHIPDRASPAGYWHLQIRRGGEPVAVAHARSTSSGEWEVLNIFGTLLAPEVDAAVRWTDENMPGVGPTRMLLIPEARIFAMWVEQRGQERIVLVNGARRTRGLATQRSYSVHRFLTGVFGRYADGGEA
jgi:hypothetical protein